MKSSMELAVEKGSYPAFENSEWSKGHTHVTKWFEYNKSDYDSMSDEDKNTYRHHEKLSHLIKENGMRNGYLLANAPTSSISLITGCLPSTEAPYKKKWFEENMSGTIPVIAAGLNAGNWERYGSVYDYDPQNMVRANAVRSKYYDQGTAFNTYINKDIQYYLEGKKCSTKKKISRVFRDSWLLGLKSNYYLRSMSPTNEFEGEETIDRGLECSSCQ